MAYNIGVANFAHTCKGQSYGVYPSWATYALFRKNQNIEIIVEFHGTWCKYISKKMVWGVNFELPLNDLRLFF